MLKFLWKRSLHLSVTGKRETFFIGGVIMVSQVLVSNGVKGFFSQSVGGGDPPLP